jgi:hypothetical protein
MLYRYIPFFKIALILLTIILGGCGPTLQSTDIKTDKNSLDSKAIVITRIHAPFTNIFGSQTDYKVNSTWEKIDSNKSSADKIRYNLGREGFFSAYNTNAMHDHMIEPGTYFLKVMTYQSGNIHYTITLPRSEMIFMAKAGEVVYIGDLKVENFDNVLSLKVEDNYEDAVKHFKEARPEINKPIQKRILIGINHSDIKKIAAALKKIKSDHSKVADKK